MKITIEADNGDITELELEDIPGFHGPIINQAIYAIKSGKELRSNRLFKNIKHTKKGNKD